MPSPAENWIAKAGWLTRSPRKLDWGERPTLMAPHKPVLLLTVCDLAERGRLSVSVSVHDLDFLDTFHAYWLVAGRQWVDVSQSVKRPDVRLPMFHLKTEGFCLPLDSDGAPADKHSQTIESRLNPEFRDLLLSAPDFRDGFRRHLISSQFAGDPELQSALAALAGVEKPTPELLAAETSAESLTADTAYEPQIELAERYARDRRFRLHVVSAYDHQCALTGLRLRTTKGSLVDAAHIAPHAQTRNNDPRNGIALSKNAHWLFDQGLWSLTDNCQILLKDHDILQATGPAVELMEGLKYRAYTGTRIFVPSARELQPDPEYLRLHRKRHGF